jgi:hypothetical protein
MEFLVAQNSEKFLTVNLFVFQQVLCSVKVEDMTSYLQQNETKIFIHHTNEYINIYIYLLHKYIFLYYCWGPLMVAQWLRYWATNGKVAGSIPDGVIGIFH